MKVLLSIKPEYANKIFDGSKKYEFRRVIFKNQNVKTVVVYVSYPIQKVVGEFEIAEILNDNLENLWNKTKNFAGIAEKLFYNYFSEKDRGFAIVIKNVKKYNTPLCLKKEFKMLPPQSFSYLT